MPDRSRSGRANDALPRAIRSVLRVSDLRLGR